MRQPARLPRIVRRSAVHGYGVFAEETIARHTRIIDYAGELLRNGEDCEAREARYLEQGCTWVFRVNRSWSRDAAVGANIARFINHSCTPNCWFEVVGKTIWIRAARTIRRGEELSYDYSIIGERRFRADAGRAVRTRSDLRRLRGRRTAIQALHLPRLSGPDGLEARGMGA